MPQEAEENRLAVPFRACISSISVEYQSGHSFTLIFISLNYLEPLKPKITPKAILPVICERPLVEQAAGSHNWASCVSSPLRLV